MLKWALEVAWNNSCSSPLGDTRREPNLGWQMQTRSIETTSATTRTLNADARVEHSSCSFRATGYGLRSIGFVLMVSAPLALSSCGGPDLRPATAPHIQLISESYAPAEVRAALVRALRSHRFAAEAEEEGHITARFTRGQEMARVVVDYTQSQFGVRYLESAGFGATTNPTGVVLVNRRFDDLVAKLEKGIVDELQRPAKDRARAEKQEREYQLMLAAVQNPPQQIVAPQPGDDPAQGEAPQDDDDGAGAADGPAPTIIQNNVVQNRIVENTVIRHDKVARAGAGPSSFCDRPVKAMWQCPNPGALNACKHDRGKCSSLCKVGGGC
jgi:hypothetical protein